MVRLVLVAVALRVQALEAVLAKTVLAVGAVTRRDHLALDAVELGVRGRVHQLPRVVLEVHVFRYRRLRPFILDDLQAPLHLLRVDFFLQPVLLRKRLQKRFQRAHHERLFGQVDLQHLRHLLHVEGGNEGLLQTDVVLRLGLVGPEHAVQPQFDVLLLAGPPAVIQKLREVVVERVLPGGFLRFVVEVANNGADALVGSPRHGKLHLGESLHDPGKLAVSFGVRIEVRKPLLENRPLSHALEHGHRGRLFEGFLRDRVRDAEQGQGIRIEIIQCLLRQLAVILQSLQRLDPQRVHIVGPIEKDVLRMHVRDPVFRSVVSFFRFEEHAGVVHFHRRLEVRGDYSWHKIVRHFWYRRILKFVHVRDHRPYFSGYFRLLGNRDHIPKGDHLVPSGLLLHADDRDLHLGLGHPPVPALVCHPERGLLGYQGEVEVEVVPLLAHR
mmetsp:Transcript_25537/g.64366  ORF Transcript_25537/g.64366 Transcript_25537/m.64366 type:complete len:441 (-) Transcript_25537:279-1601(-)